MTDAGIGRLAELPKLDKLALNNTQVTDAGLEDLGKMASLKELYLSDTLVSVEGIENLEKTLPGCKIIQNAVAQESNAAAPPAATKADSMNLPPRR